MGTERIAAASCALGMLAYTALVSLLPAPNAAGSGDDDGDVLEAIELVGVVRDFRRSHDDFNVFPAGGFGHVAGNVGYQLGEDRRPFFVGGGYRVDEEWMNRLNQPVAPHLYVPPATDVIPLVTAPQISPSSELDTWDSSIGNYGGPNQGPPPTLEIGAPMPVVLEPSNLGPSVGDLVSWPPGTIVIDEDLHCDRFSVGEGRTVHIDGDVTILCEQDFVLGDNVDFELLPGASLRLYCRQSVLLGDDADLNKNTHDPSRVLMYNLGEWNIHLAEEVKLYARVVSPGGELRLADHADFYGTFTGLTLQLADHADFHLDLAPPLDPCGVPYDERAGEVGDTSWGGIRSAATFAQWFRDHPGVNLSGLHAITLEWTPEGVWTLETDDFHPIDAQLFGNQGDDHNYYFTYVVDALFVYDECAAQIFSFEGDDDLWIFIDDMLAADLAGIRPDSAQFVEMDRLGLTDGRLYRFKLYFAQRQSISSRFKLKTNIHFMNSDQVASLSAPFD